MAAAKKTTEKNEIVVNGVDFDIRHAIIKLVGDTPLIMHKWSEKAKKEILDKQMKKAKSKGHDAKDPVRDFIDSMYWLSGEPEDKTEDGFEEAIKNGATFGFPAVAFKACAISAGYRTGVLAKKTEAQASFHIDAEFIQIHGIPRMREDMVKVGGISKTADIRYRGEFPDWWCEIPIKYNAGSMSLEQIVNLFKLGGFSCGVGEWRNEKGGTFGAFHIE